MEYYAMKKEYFSEYCLFKRESETDETEINGGYTRSIQSTYIEIYPNYSSKKKRYT